MCSWSILDKSYRKGHVYIEYRASELCFVKREMVNRTGKNIKCTSMESIRSKHQEIGEEWEASIMPVRRTMENRFRKLALKDQTFQIMCPMQENEIDYLSRHIDVMFPNMDKTKLVKSHTSKVKEYNEWVDVHCRLRHYSFQIRKCDDIECCSPSQANCNGYLIQLLMSMEITTKALKVHMEWWRQQRLTDLL